MEKQTLYLLYRNNFTYGYSETRYNVPGDWHPICWTNFKDFEPYSVELVGVYADKAIADELSKDRYASDQDVQCGEDDDFGACDCYVSMSGYYYTVAEQELETIIIKGKRYAECGNKFIQIDERTSTTENQENIVIEKI